MIGKNTLKLNEATVKAALQHWFDTVTFAAGKAPKVLSVAQGPYGTEFVVDVEEDKFADAKPPVTGDR